MTWQCERNKPNTEDVTMLMELNADQVELVNGGDWSFEICAGVQTLFLSAAVCYSVSLDGGGGASGNPAGDVSGYGNGW